MEANFKFELGQRVRTKRTMVPLVVIGRTLNHSDVGVFYWYALSYAHSPVIDAKACEEELEAVEEED